MNLVPVSSCCVLLAMWLLSAQGETVPEVSNGHRRLRSRPHLRGYALEELIGEDEDLLDNIKRQQFDDYGHMRFGKRENLDDYGHMRFGRGHH